MSKINISGGTFNQSHVGEQEQTVNVGAGARVGSITQGNATNVRAEIDRDLEALRAAVES